MGSAIAEVTLGVERSPSVQELKLMYNTPIAFTREAHRELSERGGPCASAAQRSQFVHLDTSGTGREGYNFITAWHDRRDGQNIPLGHS